MMTQGQYLLVKEALELLRSLGSRRHIPGKPLVPKNKTINAAITRLEDALNWDDDGEGRGGTDDD